MRRYNTTTLCNTAGTGTLSYGGLTLFDQSEPVAHPYRSDRLESRLHLIRDQIVIDKGRLEHAGMNHADGDALLLELKRRTLGLRNQHD